MTTGGLNRLICGMSRGGTTAMMRCLNGHPDCAAYGESSFWGRLWNDPGADGLYDAGMIDRISTRLDENSMGPVGGSGGLDFQDGFEVGACAGEAVRRLGPGCAPGDAFRAMGEAIAAHQGKRFWIEKTPHHLWHLDRIDHFLGDTRIVVMMRNPAGFLLSYKHQGDRRRPEARKRFHRLYHPATASWICKRYLEAAVKASKVRSDQVLIVLLEDLAVDPETQLRRVTDHLQIDPFPPGTEFAKDNSSFTQSAVPELAPEERMWLHLLAGAAARELGMSTEKPPCAPLRFSGSVAMLPVAAVRSLTVLPHIIRTSS